MKIMIRESNIVNEKEDFREAAFNKFENLKLKSEDIFNNNFINIIKNDLSKDLLYMEENLKIKILDEINENFILSAIGENFKNKFDELIKFENFMEFFYNLNLKIRDLIINKFKETYNKSIQILREIEVKFINEELEFQKFINNKISEYTINFENNIYNETFDLDFCRKFIIFLYRDLEYIIKFSLIHWYSDVNFEPFYLEIFHKVNTNSKYNLNLNEFYRFAGEIIKIMYNPEFLDKLK